MTNDIAGNQIRVHRRKSGLSQQELGILIGYASRHAVSQHELSKTTPPLLVALAYEIVFEVPVSELFIGFRVEVTRMVAQSLQELTDDLEQRAGNQRSNLEKIQWLLKRHVN